MNWKSNCIKLLKTNLSCKKVYCYSIRFIVNIFNMVDVCDFLLCISIADYVFQQ